MLFVILRFRSIILNTGASNTGHVLHTRNYAWFWQYKSTVHLNSINRVIVVKGTQCVFCEARAHFLSIVFFLRPYSPNFGLGLPPWNSPFRFGLLDFRHSVGLLGRVISSSQGLYLYTNTEKRARAHTNTKHPCPEWDSNTPSRLPSERRQCML
jgi:hypothetical protein